MDETMLALDGLLIALSAACIVLHVTTITMMALRCRTGSEALPELEAVPSVSIIRPVCGIETFDPVTLRSTFELTYPNYEVLFCCAFQNDPAAGLVVQLIEQHPHVKARLLIGDHVISPNPKLNNMVKGWREATGEWIIMADSNVLMPRNYVQRLLANWRKGTGVLCSPPIGCMAQNFWAEVECAFLNTYQARWQYTADTLGFGFAQGKTMLWRRRDLARAGGMGALAGEVAEDAAATKTVRRLGLNANLIDAPFSQPLGARRARQVWDRQARWSRLRRATFPVCFALEIFTGSLLPLGLAGYGTAVFDWPTGMTLMLLATLWFGLEGFLAWIAGWNLTLRSPLAWIARDLMLPALWLQAWLINDFKWRGNNVRLLDVAKTN
jgi:ceramide glucosyltransferase